MKTKKIIVLVIVTLVVLVLSGCLAEKEYSIIGTWKGKLQTDVVTITITSESVGTIVFPGGNSYTLACQKTGDKTFQMSYGWTSDYGWQQRRIEGNFTSRDEFVAYLYNQLNNEIGSGVFTRVK